MKNVCEDKVKLYLRYSTQFRLIMHKRKKGKRKQTKLFVYDKGITECKFVEVRQKLS